MTITLKKPDIAELKPRITVFGVGGGGGNAVNNMITAGLQGVDFVVANTDAQALMSSKSERIIQLGVDVTEGLGAGSHPEVGKAAAEECLDEIKDHLSNTHMCFVTAGMGGGTGTGSSPVVAKAAREQGILTVGVVTKPFHFEGPRRMKAAEAGIEELQKYVDTLIVIPNQNLFRVANEKTTFADAFSMADQVLYSGVACITDLMVKEGLINLDFADVKSVMHQMGKAMMGTGEASGEDRAVKAAEAAISNPLLDETSMKGAKGLLVSITGGRDITLFEVDQAATRIREEVDIDANIIVGATHDESLDGTIKVSVVATGIDNSLGLTVNSKDPYKMESKPSFEKPSVMAPKEAYSMVTTREEPKRAVMQDMHMAQQNNEPEEFEYAGMSRNAKDDMLTMEELLTENKEQFTSYDNNETTASTINNLYNSFSETKAEYSEPETNNQNFNILKTSSTAANNHMMRSTATATAQGGLLNNGMKTGNIVSTQLQVKPLVQESPNVAEDHYAEAGEMAEDLSQPFMEELSEFDKAEAGPRGLWKKITQSLTGKRDMDGLARLEPAEDTYISKDEYSLVRKDRLISNKDYATKSLNDEQLEIPAFLRQQNNK